MIRFGGTGLETWLKKQLEEKRVEPNSSLGGAIQYMQNHWEKLTLFLRVSGAPLDNNLVERALKRVILHRKNSLFFKTENGARVRDIFMSLIHTCELTGVMPFDYLVKVQQHRGNKPKRILQTGSHGIIKRPSNNGNKAPSNRALRLMIRGT